MLTNPFSRAGEMTVRSVGIPPKTKSSTMGRRNPSGVGKRSHASVSESATIRCPMSCANFRSLTRFTILPLDSTLGELPFCIMMRSKWRHRPAMSCPRSTCMLRARYDEGLPETMASGFTDFMCA